VRLKPLQISPLSLPDTVTIPRFHLVIKTIVDSYLTLLETLRVTLERIERKQMLAPGDPALIDLKRSVVLQIAELELRLHKDAA
jgi:hypothetical protein